MLGKKKTKRGSPRFVLKSCDDLFCHQLHEEQTVPE